MFYFVVVVNLVHSNKYRCIFFRVEPHSAGNSSSLNAPSSTAHRTEHNNVTSQVLLKSSKPSDIIQDTLSKDSKRPTSQLAGSRYKYLYFFVLEKLHGRGLILFF
jgi:hypothetical protein